MRLIKGTTLLGAGLISVLVGCGHREPVSGSSSAVLRRLTTEQYRNSIADVFGEDIHFGANFEPVPRTEGMQALGTVGISITPSGLERYDNVARVIAAQVVDEKHRTAAVPCRPKAAQDDTCARQFLSKVGRLLFRRPLKEDELKEVVAVAGDIGSKNDDFYEGLKYALSALLVAPQFVYRVERTEADPDTANASRLDAYSKATRLSFLLWNTTPDEELLAAAERGDVNDERKFKAQIDRLVASPRLTEGVRAFFTDMLGLDDMDAVAKDTIIYKKFSAQVNADAREQTLRTIVDHLLTRKEDYRELFTTRRTFLTRKLGMVYRVPVPARTWQEFEFPADDPRAGLLTQLSFLSVHSHPGRSSATLRGKAVRELVLCQPVPAPPNNVNFSVVQDTENPLYKTARGRLTAHRTDPVCAGCHKITDPIGLALENFDGLGEFRDAENGENIDASGEFDGKPFTTPAQLGKLISESSQAPACLVQKLYQYGTGSKAGADDKEWLEYMQETFRNGDYQVVELLRRLASSEGLYRVDTPPPADALANRSPPDALRTEEKRG